MVWLGKGSEGARDNWTKKANGREKTSSDMDRGAVYGPVATEDEVKQERLSCRLGLMRRCKMDVGRRDDQKTEAGRSRAFEGGGRGC